MLLDLFKALLSALRPSKAIDNPSIPPAPTPAPKPSTPPNAPPIDSAPSAPPTPTLKSMDPSVRLPAKGMRLSPAGAKFIRKEEGCVLHAYKDTVGVWTIGVGHTGPDVFPGKVISQAEAEELLMADAEKHCKPINDLVRVPITQNEYDAMASLAFNIGVSGFARSSVLRLLNEGNRQGAADAFLLWNKPEVLIGRRRRERDLFLKK